MLGILASEVTVNIITEAISSAIQKIRDSKRLPDVKENAEHLIHWTSKLEDAYSAAQDTVCSLQEENAELKKKLAHLAADQEQRQEWDKRRQKYVSDESYGFMVRKGKRTPGRYCPKCLNAEPPIEQPIPYPHQSAVEICCPLCGTKFPNPEFRKPTGKIFVADDFSLGL